MSSISDQNSNNFDQERVIDAVDVESSSEINAPETEMKPNPLANDPFAQGKIIVDWDGPDDPKNPQNWPVWRRILCTVLISLCTTSLYMGAAIYTPAIEEIVVDMHTTHVKAALGLTLFVWGYGIGSLWFSPMSEIPVFRGRNPTYFACQLIFACLQIPTALVNHIAPFAVLRFLAGIFASPPLSTAAATLSDMWQFPALGITMIIWSFGAIAGPFLGPLIGGALQQGHGRRYIFWFMLAVSGGMLVFMIVCLPETSAQELLIRKAKKLRKETGDDRYIAPGEIVQHNETASAVLKQMFYKPIKLTIMEPAVLLMDLHLGLVYSVMYLFFESFPIVYGGIHHFNYVQQGLCYLSLLVGAVIGCIAYITWMGMNANRMDKPEKVFGPTAITGACLLPVSMLIFGWCAKVGIHWVVSMVGNLFFAFGAFFMFQSYFAFLGLMFPPSATGSAFASNNIVRSLMGGAFPLFGTVMYNHTAIDNYPVGWGCTIIAIFSIMMIPLPVYLMLRGEKLRAYAQKKYGEQLYR